MRSKTEWVIGEGKDGKTAPQKLGLAPEQGKGIEYEFDLLIEMDQKHNATITKDRTGKFQDETIEKPGEDFGIALYEWLASGKAVIPEKQAEQEAPKPQEAAPASSTIPKPEPQTAGTKTPTLKEEGYKVIDEIKEVITAASPKGEAYFTENEMDDAREIIKATKLDESGIADLKDFKNYLSKELSKRVSKKAA